MSERDFIYWLSGFLENGEPRELNEEQLKTVRDHLKLVSTKVTPTNFTGQYVHHTPAIDMLGITC